MTLTASELSGLFRLDGQVAVVTGAGAGIGRAVAEMLAAAGAAVFAVERDPERAGQTASAIVRVGGQCTPVTADVTDADAMAAAFKTVQISCGRLDVLVNNAGIYPAFGRLPDGDWQTYQRTIDVNLHSALRASMLAAKLMQPGGRLINISSIEGLRPSTPGTAHYSISKAAMNGLTRAAALDLAPLGIRVNAVLPGVVRTEGTSALSQEAIAGLAERIPAGRLGEPSDIAGAVLYLASALSTWVSGHCLVVDGGTTSAG